MDEFKKTFISFFDEYNKDKCVQLVIENLKNKKITIQELYEEVLRPVLCTLGDCNNKENSCIWMEHVKTSIIRTVIESIYPFVIEQKNNVQPLGIKVVLVCPENEYHEVGLRMVSDFFSLNGYESIFIGTNTPRDETYLAIAYNNPKYVAISVTDYYLLFEAQKMIGKIRAISNGKIIIIVGGNAFKNNLESISKIGGDIYFEKYSDIVSLRTGDLI
ncbi:MAG: B12-binding domain-containing protein [Sedimentibacter sp.]